MNRLTYRAYGEKGLRAMTIKQFLNKFWYGASTIKRVYVYRCGNLVEWFEIENIRDHCYLGWGDKKINSFQIQNDSIKIHIA